jgi:hypothetical protein
MYYRSSIDEIAMKYDGSRFLPAIRRHLGSLPSSTESWREHHQLLRFLETQVLQLTGAAQSNTATRRFDVYLSLLKLEDGRSPSISPSPLAAVDMNLDQRVTISQYRIFSAAMDGDKGVRENISFEFP